MAELSIREKPEQVPTQTPVAAAWAHRSGQGEIRVEDVSVRFKRNGEAFTALAPVNLTVAEGAFISFLGPSGCGKTTLLNVIAGMLKPATGRVLIDGTPVVKPTPKCNVVFQQHSLFPWMKVIDNVAFGPGQLGDAIPEATARTFLSLVGLDNFARLYPSQLSGGMQQRVAIARALATYPLVLLMDEPFGALDAQTRSIMQTELLNIWANFNTTVIFVTHDVDEAIYLSDQIVVMRTTPGAVKEIIDVSLPRPRTSEVMQSAEFAAIRRRVIDLIREETLKIFNTGQH